MYDKNSKSYDPIYGKVMGMINAGLNYGQVADSLHIAEWRVIDIVQIAFGRSRDFYGNVKPRRES